MHLVEKVLYENFKHWKESASNKSSEDEFSSFMEEKYQIKEKGLNILDILNTMISPKAGATNFLTQSQLACGKLLARRKRESVPSELITYSSLLLRTFFGFMIPKIKLPSLPTMVHQGVQNNQTY